MMDKLAWWIAKEKGLKVSRIHNIYVEASATEAWSEDTVEPFSCWVKFLYEGERRTEYLDERDVVRFLNEAWETKPRYAAHA